jgi:hypothetical protein
MTVNKTFVGIAGGNSTGITVLDSAGAITTLDSYQAGAPWRPASAPGVVFDAICGNAVNGVAGLVEEGNVIKYATVVNSLLGKWKSAAPLADIKASRISGHPAGTLVAFGGSSVATLDPTTDGAQWVKLKDAPGTVVAAFGAPVSGLYAMVNTDRRSLLYKFTPEHTDAASAADAKAAPDAKPAAPVKVAASWDLVPATALPFVVEQMCGDAASGYAFYGEGQLYSTQDFNKPPTRLPSPSFRIKALSGSAKDGLVALAGNGDFVVYCADPSKPAWNVALGPLEAEAAGAS